MAEPARKPRPEIEPDIRPNLRSVQGGGESTPDRGNLRAVDGTARDLNEQEKRNRFNVIQGGGESTPDRAKLSSAEASGDDFNYKPPSAAPGQDQKKNWLQRTISNKRALTGIGIGGSITALAISGFIAFLPLKLEMLVKEALSNAMQLPQDAVENASVTLRAPTSPIKC